MNPAWKPALDALKVNYLYPYQELVIAQTLESPELRQGVVLPTGAGKSLCFQIPALLFEHPTLVVYPLRSLMADQKRRCDVGGIPAAVLQGGQTRAQRDEVFCQLERGEIKLLLTNPETLIQPKLLVGLEGVQFDHAVLDEAHCFTLWGNDFRPTYRQVPAALDQLKIPRWTAFSATASPRVTQDWSSNLFSRRPWSLIRGSSDRPNLDFARVPYLSLRATLPALLTREPLPALVFCRSREGVRQWAHHIHRETGLDVRHYHAGLSREEKQSVEDWFYRSNDGVLVATNAYGMGVDKPNIRTVIHLEAPDKTEDYLQEAGRAGRDGLPARALLAVASRTSLEISAGCWRTHLLSVFGEVPQACQGCDDCRGQTRRLPAELEQVCVILQSHRGRLDRRECQALLRGRTTASLRGLESWQGWGLWSHHDDLTFRQLWQALEAEGWIDFHRGAQGLLRGVNLI